jgi:hypothetical protein
MAITPLDVELARLARLASQGVRAARIEARTPASEGYREGAGRGAPPSLRLEVRAGLPRVLLGVLVVVAAALYLGAYALAEALGLGARHPLTIALVVAVPVLVFGVPALLLRDRRLDLTPTAIVVHPPRPLVWRAPRTVPLETVRELVVRHDEGRADLVALTIEGEKTLLAGLSPAAVVADLPRVLAAYRTALAAGEG